MFRSGRAFAARERFDSTSQSPPMAAITNSSRNSAQPRFKRHTRSEFGKRIATSKGICRLKQPETTGRSEASGNGMIASTSGTSLHIGAIFTGAATVTRERLDAHS